MSGLHFNLPFYYFIFFSIISFFATFYLYKKELVNKSINSIALRSIFILRLITLISLFFLLLEPSLFKSNQVSKKPILVFAQDNSESIKNSKDSLFYLTDYRDSIKIWINKLKPFYDVRFITFGDKVINTENFSLDAKSTNYEQFYKVIKNQFYNTNFTDLIIASDGLINIGKSSRSLLLPEKINVNTLLLGDTVKYPDLVVKSIIHNKYSLFENKFPLEIIVESNTNPCKANIDLYKNDKLVQQITTQINKGINIVKFVELADQKGFCDYKVKINSKVEEKNYANNSKISSIEIIDYSQNILILSTSPHPDIGALNSIFKDLSRTKTNTFLADKFNNSIDKYDLIIFHKPFENKLILNQLQLAKEKSIPTLVFSGENLNLNQSQLNLIGLKNKNFKGSSETMANLNEDFKLFKIEDEWKRLIPNFPPLSVPFSSNYFVEDNSNILCFQNINGVKMSYPLIYFYNSENISKSATVLGEGIWKWKMNEFKNFNNSNVFSQLFKKIAQCLKKIDKKERLAVSIPNRGFEDQSFKVYAEFYNSSFELQNQANLKFTIFDSIGNKYNKQLLEIDNHYEVDIYNLKNGEYDYEIIANYKGEIFKKRGTFTIISSNKETMNTVASLDNLKLLSTELKVHYISQMSSLINKLNSNGNDKIEYYNETNEYEIIHYWWLLFIILVFPSLEWFIRKSSGLI